LRTGADHAGFFAGLAALAGQAEAACTVPRWRFVWDIETDAYMQSDGGRCWTRLTRTSGKTEVHSISIASPPRHGAASVSGLNVFYTPGNGFKGDDAFVFAIQGRDPLAGDCASLRDCPLNEKALSRKERASRCA